MFKRLKNCHNVQDMRELAKQRLPSPIFHYIDGAADDEITYRRNTDAFDSVDLVPNVLAGVDEIDMSVEVLGQTLDIKLCIRHQPSSFRLKTIPGWSLPSKQSSTFWTAIMPMRRIPCGVIEAECVDRSVGP